MKSILLHTSDTTVLSALSAWNHGIPIDASMMIHVDGNAMFYTPT